MRIACFDIKTSFGIHHACMQLLTFHSLLLLWVLRVWMAQLLVLEWAGAQQYHLSVWHLSQWSSELLAVGVKWYPTQLPIHTVTDHEVIQTGLQCGTTYYIRVVVTGELSLGTLVSSNQVQVLVGGKVIVSFPDHFSPHGKKWSGERPIPFLFPPPECWRKMVWERD